VTSALAPLRLLWMCDHAQDVEILAAVSPSATGCHEPEAQASRPTMPGVAEPLKGGGDRRTVDLSGTRFATAGDVGDLDPTDQRASAASRDPHVDQADACPKRGCSRVLPVTAARTPQLDVRLVWSSGR
jgi:hypothetical protein